jgi:hypothetical protein
MHYITVSIFISGVSLCKMASLISSLTNSLWFTFDYEARTLSSFDLSAIHIVIKFQLHPDRRSVVLVSGPHLAPMSRFLLLLDICGFHVVGRPPWREDGSVIYLYKSLSLSGQSPAELKIFYCLIWGSPNLEGQAPVFIFPRNRVAPDSLSVASHDSQQSNS